MNSPPNTNSLKMSTINIKIEETSCEVENNQIKIKIEETPSEEYTENPNDESQFKQEEEEEVMNKKVKKGFCEARSAQSQCCQKVFQETSTYYKYKLKKKSDVVNRIKRAEMKKAKVFIKM